MNETQITGQSIIYLAKFIDALQFEMRTEHARGNEAMEVTMDCARYLQQIGAGAVNQDGLRSRMKSVAEAMLWLSKARLQHDALFLNSHLSIPSVPEVEALMLAANLKFDSREGKRMLANLQNEMRELLDLVRETSAYAATLAARPDIDPAESAQAEQQRKSQRIVQLRERWDL